LAGAEETNRSVEVEVLTAHHIRRLVPLAGVSVLAALVVGLLLRLGARVDLVMKAAGIPKSASGLGGFVNGAHALVTPALVMAAAIAPLTLVVGGVVLMFGGRRGMQIVGTSLGVLLLLGSVTALID
jgi:hypothetical protein